MMKRYVKKLEKLKYESDVYFSTDYKTENEDSVENIRIKNKILTLIVEAKKSATCSEEYSIFKKLVVDYLCEICGCYEDLQILYSSSPRILSLETVEYIKQNSALSRWS